MTTLGIVPPLRPEEFCRLLAEHRGRPLRVTGADLGCTTSVGHLLVLENLDRIFYNARGPRPQQVHVIFHEVIHLLRDHASDEPLLCGALVPAQDPSVGSNVAGDDGFYTDWQEREAETGATILFEMTLARAYPNRLATLDGAPEEGIAATFGLSADGWPEVSRHDAAKSTIWLARAGSPRGTGGRR